VNSQWNKREDGGAVLTLTSDEGVTTIAVMTREEVQELLEAGTKALSRQAKVDWREMKDGHTPDLADDLRYLINGKPEGVQIVLGSMDNLRALGGCDEATAKRLLKDLSHHLGEIRKGNLIRLGDTEMERRAAAGVSGDTRSRT